VVRCRRPDVHISALLGDILSAKVDHERPAENSLATQQREGGVGEILVAEGALTLTELELALAEQEGLETEVPTSLHSPFGTSRYGAAP
jgi:hypothetical protein